MRRLFVEGNGDDKKKEKMIGLISKVIWTEMAAMSTVLTGVTYVECTKPDEDRKTWSRFGRHATPYDRLRP